MHFFLSRQHLGAELLHDGLGQDLGAELHLNAAQDQDLRPELL